MNITLKRSLACMLALFALMLLLFSVSACTPDEGNAETTEALTSTTAENTTTTEETTTTEAQTVTPPEEYLAMPYAEKAGKISVYGTPISEFVIVIPENCDQFTKNAAQNFSEYIANNTSINLNTVTDTTPAAEHEFVFGATNRPISEIIKQTSLEAGQYAILHSENSIAFNGNGYMIGAGAGRFLTYYAAGAWRGFNINITNIPDTATATEFVFEAPKNAILIIGDGMGRAQVDMALDKGGLALFSADQMPVRGEIITASQSVLDGADSVTDSAAAGTALATGYKTLNGYLGVGPDEGKLLNVRELAYKAGAKTAILTTDSINGATPSAFYAHVAGRSKLDEIAKDLNAVKKEKEISYSFGDLNDGNFLKRAVFVLNGISKNGDNFFIMIEEGQIDKQCHSTNAEGTISTVKRLDTVVAYCMEFMFFHPDTLLIVTADHETGGLKKVGENYSYTDGVHTNVNVPIYAMGVGSEYFNDTVRDNTRVPVQIAKIFSSEPFGDVTKE